MKYTPEELLEYVKGNPELYAGALNALFNNDKGFGYLPVDPETFRIDKGKACVVMPMFKDGEWQDEEIAFSPDYLLLDFFQLTEINTKGRLKAAIKKGWEMFEEDAAMREERELFLDACGVEEDYL